MINNKCEICGCLDGEQNTKGRKIVKYRKCLDKVLCEKHYKQHKSYGKFLDNSKYTVWDLNEIYIKDNTGIIVIRNNIGNPIAEALIDVEDIDKVKDFKWRVSQKRNKTYIISRQAGYLARFILGCTDSNLFVDHISGDELDNRKSNLRIVTLNENTTNIKKKINNTSGIRGVSYDKFHDTWNLDFSYNTQRFYFKPFKTKEECVYLRYLLEIYFQKEFRNTSNDESYFKEINKLDINKKLEIENYFEYKTGINIEKSRV